MFFYANNAILINQADFWEKSAGKSLQLISHIPRDYVSLSGSCNFCEIEGFGRSKVDYGIGEMSKNIGGLTLPEVFRLSLVGLIVDDLPSAVKNTDYSFRFQFGKFEYTRLEDMETQEVIYPFPTLLLSFQDDFYISGPFPFQKNSTVTSRVLNWQVYIVEVDERLEIDGFTRSFACYLLAKIRESIRNSVDDNLLRAPDCLSVFITKDISNGGVQHNKSSFLSSNLKLRNNCFGIDALNLLNFTYKVPWPLELIVKSEAIKKYNQVMGFLLKVKRAKFVLDKARRVFHSSWLELCEGMTSDGSLDEVLEAHEAYLLSIQRQCFVVPDKLWALIASRIKNILGLALDFYSVQETLISGGTALAIKARREKEIFS
ncbi:hypothetical protein GIB67_032581 [Kingdonia uniflora]|uniref:Gamma-tubulin complex component n=1 Tax=Kingdonia uniflora TaxID=39325 RepID=A0A7J7LSC9_9MAGN|nr:hypothetical protein GIB67_032581 [Kingdonia uniflora]